jgi:hypothetical protein
MCASLVAMAVAKRFPQLFSVALRRSRLAGLNVSVATIVFLGLAGLPPILWRLRFGVWM